MSVKTDIRDIVLFVVGILLLIFPPAWVTHWSSWSEEHEVFLNISGVLLFFGILFLGRVYNWNKGKK